MANVGNWPLLIKTVQHIIDLPEAWNQGTWVSPCGTHRCVAGWAAEFGGLKPVLEPQYTAVGAVWNPHSWIFTGEIRHTNYFYQPGENPHADDAPEPSLTSGGYESLLRRNGYGADYAPTAAAKVLGLGLADHDLFEMANTLGDILYMVNLWAAADGVELPETFAVGDNERYTTLPEYDNDYDDDEYDYDDEEY